MGYVELVRLPVLSAQILRGALESEGIDAVLDNETVGPYGLDAGWFATRLFVPEHDEQRARALLAEFEADDHADPDTAPGTDPPDGEQE